MVNPSTDTIEGLAGQFKLAEANYEEALAAFNQADELLYTWENRLMNKMQRDGLEQITIGSDVYKIVGVRLQKIPTTLVYPSPTAPLL